MLLLSLCFLRARLINSGSLLLGISVGAGWRVVTPFGAAAALLILHIGLLEEACRCGFAHRSGEECEGVAVSGGIEQGLNSPATWFQPQIISRVQLLRLRPVCGWRIAFSSWVTSMPSRPSTKALPWTIGCSALLGFLSLCAGLDLRCSPPLRLNG